ncbi:hypothetical protein ACFUMH_07910 [Cellulomonas sp. NPDC057328]|uniref:hypothetical protein n=1 Tax=Cellulomonas sp. NPDC057328 TaxID=3346101 RepID=UPI0036312D51
MVGVRWRERATAVALVAALAGCADVADDEITAEEVCENLPASPFLTVSTVSDARGVGITWTELPLLLDEDKSYTVYRRAPGGSPSAEGWEVLTGVVLAPGAPREIVPVDLPPGVWEVGVTYSDPECGESPVCGPTSCASVVLEAATEPSAT